MIVSERPSTRVSESHRVPSQHRHAENEIQVNLAPRRPGYLPLKLTIEWLVALTLLVVSSPMLLLMALAVKVTSAGPALYKQARMGKHGRVYHMYKLRTMIHNAERGTGPVWAAKDDVRTTAVGRILRRTHMDELPQLLNVIRGEMSLIGPRPERPEIVNRIEPEIKGYRLRLLVRPGITGLAQMLVSADDPSDHRLLNVRRKLAHDVYYVREVNPMLDLRIAICTPVYFLAEATVSMRDVMVRSYGSAVKRRLVPADTEDERYLSTNLHCLAEEGSSSKADFME